MFRGIGVVWGKEANVRGIAKENTVRVLIVSKLSVGDASRLSDCWLTLNVTGSGAVA